MDSPVCPSVAVRQTKAFTLVEVMMSLAVTGLVFSGILAGYLHCTTLALR
ncbi:MAG: prepilin-type N-terminal cleavage/methylation domain-containing protein [Verrucomicrobia bacterium]|nr:prepilin-type N-terminal cleavage/methylation domain-containing protein [Verrucomicrobiota bacterium]